MRRTRLVAFGVVAAVAIAIAVFVGRGRPPADASPSAEPDAASPSPPNSSARVYSSVADGSAPWGVTVSSSGVYLSAGWGAGPGQLGRDRPAEGNPEAPMSMAWDPRGGLMVLDQVNGRLVRYGPDGKPVDSIPVTVQAPQDVVVAGDGTTLVLDRLADRSIAILDPTGQLVGELQVEGRGIDEGGAVTGIFVDGEDVYVEREHADLVRVGDIKGRADSDRPEVPGRPSRDGQSFISAGLTDPPAGRLYVNSIARPGLEHRFTRELRAGMPVAAIVLLDTDRAGVIHLGLAVEMPTGKPQPASAPAVLLLCLDPLDGRTLGKAELPANTSPEETFRELVVLDQGGVLYSIRTEEGLQVRRFECR